MATQILRPQDASQLAGFVKEAAQKQTVLTTRAGNSKWDLGCRESKQPTEQVISLDALSGIVSYEPGELVLVVGAGTPLRQIEQLLSDEGQHLAFEPVHWRDTATVGGTVAVGLAGPRRFRAGGVRDFVLGLQFVDGQGRLVRTGGRVVKNVTGYDLWRGLTGSFGSLGLITEICFKLWPRPQTQRTLLLARQDLETARRVMLELAQRPEDLTGIAFAPHRGVSLRLEGSDRGLQPQIDAIARDVDVEEELPQIESANFWSQLREVEALRQSSGRVWRFVLPAGHWVALVHDLQAAQVDDYFVDWGGGLVWALAPPEQTLDGHRIAERHGAIAWRVATSLDDPNELGMPSLEPGLKRLNQRLRTACDPGGILNPGRSGL